MTQIKPDGIITSNQTTPFLNYATSTGTFTISGNVPNGVTLNTFAVFTLSRLNSLVDVYATNENTGKKMSLLAGRRHNPYQAVSTETSSHALAYASGQLNVSVDVTNNTGGPITLTSQVWTITAVQYDVPYS